MLLTKDGYCRYLVELWNLSDRIHRIRARLRAEGVPEGGIDRQVHALESLRKMMLVTITRHEEAAGILACHDLAGIGPLLIRLRHKCGVSIRELARRIGVDVSCISLAEKIGNRRISLKRADQILKALNAEIRLTVIPSSPEVGRRILQSDQWKLESVDETSNHG